MLKEIHSSWKTLIEDQFSQDYFKILSEFVTSEYNTQTIYPTQKEIFKAFDLCRFNKTKVIIIGQDPYHGLNQANGLSFAVHKNISLPPHLKIFLRK